jgi:N-acylneuraminate cytidylyltransferase/CMP-N,N'-diacetyllegionaminic acid synthase
MNILCIIPARGGSKRLKDKNIIPLIGKPIIAYTIEAALQSHLANKIIISTDDEKIARVAMKYDIQVVKRPKEYSTDTAPIEQALRHVVRFLKGEEGYLADIVGIQANIPIRKKGQIDEVLRR